MQLWHLWQSGSQRKNMPFCRAGGNSPRYVSRPVAKASPEGIP